MFQINKIKKNRLIIEKEIAPYTPKIIAVTKYFDENAITDAYKIGLRDFGESRVLEAVAKIEKLPKEVKINSTFHLIGHLQTNKVKQAIGKFEYIHSVDSLKLAEAINNRALELGIRQKILLQINNANEEQKFGFSKQELGEVFAEIKNLSNIEVTGLMNIAPFGLKEEELFKLFKDIADFKKELETEFNCEIKELSMGMSDDYGVAVRAGATMIRVGRKLFS